MGLFDRLRKKNVVQTDDNLQTAQSAAIQDARKGEKKDEETTEEKKVVAKKAAAPKTKKAKADKTEEPSATDVKKATAQGSNAYASAWLKKPHTSEKAAFLQAAGAYVFDVPMDAEKIAVRKAVESLYKVKVTGVRMIRRAGKPVNRGRHHAHRAATKKAIVTLVKGQKLDLFEGV